MKLRSITTGLVFLGALLLVVACGDTDVTSPNSGRPTHTPTAVTAPTATAGIIAATPDDPTADGPTATPLTGVIGQATETPTQVIPTTETPALSQPTAGHDAPVGPFDGGGSSSTDSEVIWLFNGSAWTPNGTAPSCPEPLGLQTPVDMSIVTAALWPGQQRGAYVAHGGFRFDNNVDNDVIVRAPLGSHLVQAANYLESGKPQYLLFFSSPCGFFYRFDHVLEVSPEMAEALKDVPAADSGDSRTSFINPPLWVDKGDIVGTAVGISATNIFVDFGLYDVRQPNNVTPDPAWADLFAGDKEFGHYGVCMFDYLSGTDGDTMRSLPTGKEGKNSDFCD